jgi:hypothetical protein
MGKHTDDVTLVAASDYQGEVIVVAGERSQLYIFRKRKNRYLLEQVLWDGAASFPVSLAITENGHYAVMITGKNVVAGGNEYGPYLSFVIWDIAREEKVQELETYGTNGMLATAGRALVMRRGDPHIINAGFSMSSIKYTNGIFVTAPEGVLVAYAPLARQILVKNSAASNLTLYKVRDEAREKWWKWRSNNIALEKKSDAFRACSPENRECSLDVQFPAFEVAPDGKFFVIWRGSGMLEAYSLPDGTFMSRIQTMNDMDAKREPHLTIVDGVVYLANGTTNPFGTNPFSPSFRAAFWSWRPGDAELRSHDLECADYTRLLNNGYIATLGCRDKGMELRFVALADHFRVQAFSQPLRLQ